MRKEKLITFLSVFLWINEWLNEIRIKRNIVWNIIHVLSGNSNELKTLHCHESQKGKSQNRYGPATKKYHTIDNSQSQFLSYVNQEMEMDDNVICMNKGWLRAIQIIMIPPESHLLVYQRKRREFLVVLSLPFETKNVISCYTNLEEGNKHKKLRTRGRKN